MLIKSFCKEARQATQKRIRKRKSNVVNKPVSPASSYKEVEGEVAHDVENWGLGLGSSVQKCLSSSFTKHLASNGTEMCLVWTDAC